MKRLLWWLAKTNYFIERLSYENQIVIPEIVMTALSLVILFGSFTFFAACPVADEGSIMSCHYAQVM